MDHVIVNARTKETTVRAFTAQEELAATPAPLTLAELYAHSAAKRWAVETGGIVIDLGGTMLAVPTDERTQLVLTAAWAKASADPLYGIADWKVDLARYRSLDAATILAIANAVERHVQACFTANKVVDAAIGAGSITTRAGIDAASWPPNG